MARKKSGILGFLRNKFATTIVALVTATFAARYWQQIKEVVFDRLVARVARKTDTARDDVVKPVPGVPVSRSTGDTIKVASFNIQVFGTSKLAKPDVMAVLAKVIRRFDVVAIQEIRSVDDSVIPRFIQMINADGSKYHFVIGPRLGRTNSKEQYAYLYDTNRLEVDPASVFTYPDPSDRLHRTPLAARFRVRGIPSEKAFSFYLVNIHTDPDETTTELNALGEVFLGMQRNTLGEDDIIVLGDLNVDDRHLGNLGRVPDIVPALTRVTTNTRRNKMYDNIVFSGASTTEYTGRAEVFDLMTEYGLSTQQALEISDHLPIWAEFSVYESGPHRPVTGIPTSTGR